MNIFKDKTNKNKTLKHIPVVIVLSLLIITLYVWSQATHRTSLAYQEYFDFRVREAISDIITRMSGYQQVLYGTRGLYEASKEVTREEFRRYVFSLHLEDNFHGIQGVGFSLIIPPDQKEAHLSTVHKEGYPEYNIRPEGDRDLFTSIVFLEPLADRNLRAFGYDMYSEPVRREAMERARDTDMPAMSGKVRLVQEYGKKEQAGFLIYIPVYNNEHPHDTLSNRQSNIIGWVYSPFRMGDLMEGIFGEHSQDIDVEIYDDDQLRPEFLMYDSDGVSFQKNYSNGKVKLMSTQAIDIAGHTWTIAIQALPNLFTRVETEHHLPILIIGTTASFLLGCLSWLLISGRERALKAAREMNIQYIESENRLQTILDSSAIGIAWADQNGNIEYVNPQFIAMFGYTIKDVPTVDQWHVRAYPDSNYRNKIVTQWNAMIEETINAGSHFPHLETEITCYDGSVKQVTIMGSWAGSKLLVNFNDITDRKKAEELARYASQHDTLTGLANRALFSDRLEQAINMAKRDKHNLAVFIIDVDKFKSVNDSFGHQVGDSFLKEVAKRIKDCLRETDVVARMGGDEFLIFMRKFENEEDVKLVSEKIRFVLSHPVLIDEHSIVSSVSIGIAIYPKHGDTEELLIKNADFAMYKAKQYGRDAVEFFIPDDS